MKLSVLLKSFLKKQGQLSLLQGLLSLVCNENIAYAIYNGHEMMSSITGTGCQLSALTTSFVSANPDYLLEATVAAVCTMGLAGEIAHERLTPLDGNASYRNYIIDAIYNMTPKQLQEGSQYKKI